MRLTSRIQLQSLPENPYDLTCLSAFQCKRLNHGLVFSQRVLLALVDKGLVRQAAYGLVQRNAMRSWEEGLDFKTLLLADAEVCAQLSREEIETCFSMAPHVAHVDAIFKRVFGDA